MQEWIMHIATRSLNAWLRWSVALLLAGLFALPSPVLAQEATPVTDETPGAMDAVEAETPDVSVSATDYFQQESRQVTFSITVSGSAPGGTTIDITSQFGAGLTPLGVQVGGGMPESNASATWLSGDSTSSAWQFQVTVTSDGEYSDTFAVLTNANPDVPPGSTLTTTACAGGAGGPEDACGSASVTTVLDEHLTAQLTCAGPARAVEGGYEQDLGVTVTGTGMQASDRLLYGGFSDSAGTLPSATSFDPVVGAGSEYDGTVTLQFGGSVPTGQVTYSLIWIILGGNIQATDTAQVTCPAA
jgi:hypothetical protein